MPARQQPRCRSAETARPLSPGRRRARGPYSSRELPPLRPPRPERCAGSRVSPYGPPCPSPRTDDVIFVPSPRRCGLARQLVASGRARELKSRTGILSIARRGPPSFFRSAVAMPYDVTTITVAPNAHMKAQPFVEKALAATPRKGEFLACLYAEIGELNRIKLIHHYANEADLAADRKAQAETANPFGMGDIFRGMTSDTFLSFPFMPPLKAGQFGPIF